MSLEFWLTVTVGKIDCRLADNMITLLSCAFAFSGHLLGLPLSVEAATACSVLQAAGSLILRQYCVLHVLRTEFVIVLPCIALNNCRDLSLSASAAVQQHTCLRQQQACCHASSMAPEQAGKVA